MERPVKGFWKLIGISIITAQMVILFLSATVAFSKTIDLNPTGQPLSHRTAETVKILSVLENRMEDRKIIEKARGKLFHLSDRQFSLMVSLSERIAREGNKTGTEMAFLLMTVLITLA